MRDDGQGIRPDEFVFGVPDRQDRARRQPDDLLGHAPHQHVRQAAAPVRAHHNQIDAVPARVVDDGERRRSGCQDDGCCPGSAAVAVDQEPLELEAGRLFDLRLQSGCDGGVGFRANVVM